eukprot:Hpha_TRINITY_DN16262_c3_g3::TRINITY_DN16262_c3_g3_i1::g.15538::m.15538/K12191/CHMP2A; charged multivesicular body protein 2A
MVFGNLFGKKKTPEEMMREYKRQIDRTAREMDRERMKMEQTEKKLMADMRKFAKQNQMETVRIMAKDLVRTRQYQTKFAKMKGTLMAVSLRLQTLNSTAAMANAMKGVTKAMRGMNSKMNLPAMQKIMMDFERQNEMMGMKEEMMSDAIDSAMDSEGEEEDQTESLVQSVLDEIGLDMKAQMGVGQGQLAPAAKQEEESDDLQARLDKLRK